MLAARAVLYAPLSLYASLSLFTSLSQASCLHRLRGSRNPPPPCGEGLGVGYHVSSRTAHGSKAPQTQRPPFILRSRASTRLPEDQRHDKAKKNRRCMGQPAMTERSAGGHQTRAGSSPTSRGALKRLRRKVSLRPSEPRSARPDRRGGDLCGRFVQDAHELGE